MPRSDLIARYKTRAPRYTSYPTAPHFADIASDDVHRALAASTDPFSLYVHLPFCSSLCWYCGCSVEVRKKRSVASPYVGRILDEAQLVAERFSGVREIAQLSLGGGTPTFLKPQDMTWLIRGLRQVWDFTPDADLSIEIDPRAVSTDYLHMLWQLGFRRFSFGVQDFDPDVLRAVHRWQPRALTEGAMKWLRDMGAPVVNFDLLYGLPLQTERTWENTLAQAMELRPTRIALFQYAHVPWMRPQQKLLERHPFPSSEDKAQMFARAEELFAEHGYQRIGMDHFALRDDPLAVAARQGRVGRNFQGYTTHADLDLIGLGVTAIGRFGGVFSQNKKNRAEWEADVDAGRLPVERGLVCTPEDLVRGRAISSIMGSFRLRWRDVGGVRRWERERPALESMEADGLVEVGPDELVVTELGRDFVRNVAAVFDAYLEADASQRRYSQTA